MIEEILNQTIDKDLNLIIEKLQNKMKIIIQNEQQKYLETILNYTKKGILFLSDQIYCVKQEELRTTTQQIYQFLQEQEKKTPEYIMLRQASNLISRIQRGTEPTQTQKKAYENIQDIPKLETL
ncbi:hypothetical protein B6U93_02780, partial [Candidatus Woesearchaeota archaeon ex4484_78]